VDIFLIDSEGTEMWIPVNPPEVSISREKRIDTLNIVGIGEIDFSLPGQKIKSITFSSFFPAEYDPSYCKHPDLDPQGMMQQLTTWMDQDKPLRLIITDTQVNVLVHISAHASKFVGGEPDDVYYDLTMRVYREVKIRKYGEQTTGAYTGGYADARTNIRTIPKVYIVKKDDDLFKIAKVVLGDSSRSDEIYNIPENIKTIGPNRYALFIGQKLVMPV